MNEHNLTATLSNTFADPNADGWAMLAPYGDAENVASLVDPKAFAAAFPDVDVSADGKVAAIQRITQEDAASLVNDWKGSGNRVKRFAKGSPIYLEHPDAPGRTGDKTQRGVMADLQAREDGLYGFPVFNPMGAELLNSKDKFYFSVRIQGVPAGIEQGKVVYRPTALISTGLTTNPNLASELLNSAPKKDGATNTMNKQSILAALAALGATLANDASEDQITTAISGLGEKAKLVGTLENEKAKLVASVATLENDKATLAASLENERKAHRSTIVQGAIADGRITAAEAPLWERRLSADLVNEAPVLAALPRKIKTAPYDQAAIEAAAAKGGAELANAKQTKEEPFEAARRMTREQLEKQGMKLKTGF